MKKFIVRLKTCYCILFRRYNHWVLFDLSSQDLNNLLMDKPFDLDIMYHGVQPYVYKKAVKHFSDSITDIDMICDKAKFYADSQTFKY